MANYDILEVAITTIVTTRNITVKITVQSLSLPGPKIHLISGNTLINSVVTISRFPYNFPKSYPSLAKSPYTFILFI